jgi:hypothetical protein
MAYLYHEVYILSTTSRYDLELSPRIGNHKPNFFSIQSWVRSEPLIHEEIRAISNMDPQAARVGPFQVKKLYYWSTPPHFCFIARGSIERNLDQRR